MAVLKASFPWPSVAGTTLLWAAAAASVVFWGLRLSAPAEAALPPVAAAAPLQTDATAVARLLGAPVATSSVGAPIASSGNRFKLLGVVADEQGRGAALISIDGKPARPYRAGQPLVDGHVLQVVEGRSARISVGSSQAQARGTEVLELSLPALPMAQNAPPRQPPTLSN